MTTNVEDKWLNVLLVGHQGEGGAKAFIGMVMVYVLLNKFSLNL